MPRARRWSTRLGVSLATGAVLLLAVEVGMRVAGFDPLGGLFQGQELVVRPAAHPLLDNELSPGASGEVWGGPVAINSLGLRDREYAREKPAGTRRVLVLGDSVTFGIGVPAEETFPARLEARLAPRDPPVEVLNLGVGGYDTLDEVIAFEARGLDLGPDVVVVGYCLNDLAEVSLSLRYVQRIARYGSMFRFSRAYQWLVMRLDALDLKRETRRRSAPEPEWSEADFDVPPVSGSPEVAALQAELASALDDAGIEMVRLRWYTSAARLTRLRYAFERLRGLSALHDFEIVVALLPLLTPDTGGLRRALDAVDALVEHEAERAGFAALRLRPDLPADPRPLRLSPRDAMHMNAAGHALVAASLGRGLRELGLVD